MKMSPHSFAGLPVNYRNTVASKYRINRSSKEKFVMLLDNACELTGADKNDVLKGSRISECVKTKRIYCHYLRKYTNMSLDSIGRGLGLNHATVLHHFRTCEEWISVNDQEYSKLVNDYKIINNDLFVY